MDDIAILVGLIAVTVGILWPMKVMQQPVPRKERELRFDLPDFISRQHEPWP